MNHFIALDVETANSSHSSICSLGIVEVKEGEIINEKYWIIRPNPLIIEHHNSSVNNFKREDFALAPLFSELWHKIEPFFQVKNIVVHNVGFDRTKINATLESIGIQIPDNEYHCTYKLSKQFYTLPDYKLPTIAEHIGHQINEYHNALDDAKACAMIYLHLADNFPIHQSVKKNSSKSIHKPSISIPKLKESVEINSQKLSNYQFVFTGEMNLSREDATKKVLENGGKVSSSVSSKTTHVVVGEYEGITSKHQKAVEKEIPILSEVEFLSLISH